MDADAAADAVRAAAAAADWDGVAAALGAASGDHRSAAAALSALASANADWRALAARDDVCAALAALVAASCPNAEGAGDATLGAAALEVLARLTDGGLGVDALLRHRLGRAVKRLGGVPGLGEASGALVAAWAALARAADAAEETQGEKSGQLTGGSAARGGNSECAAGDSVQEKSVSRGGNMKKGGTDNIQRDAGLSGASMGRRTMAIAPEGGAIPSEADAPGSAEDALSRRAAKRHAELPARPMSADDIRKAKRRALMLAEFGKSDDARPAKRVSFAGEGDLVSVRYFVPDDGDAPGPADAARALHLRDEAAFAREVRARAPDVEWVPPAEVPGAPARGAGSTEREAQAARERLTLAARYYSDAEIPFSPAEAATQSTGNSSAQPKAMPWADPSSRVVPVQRSISALIGGSAGAASGARLPNAAAPAAPNPGASPHPPVGGALPLHPPPPAQMYSPPLALSPTMHPGASPPGLAGLDPALLASLAQTLPAGPPQGFASAYAPAYGYAPPPPFGHPGFAGAPYAPPGFPPAPFPPGYAPGYPPGFPPGYAPGGPAYPGGAAAAGGAFRHPKYRTVLCKNYRAFQPDSCRYGDKCQFIHRDE